MAKKRRGGEGSGCAITETPRRSSRRDWRRPASGGGEGKECRGHAQQCNDAL
jgi:hypothetical protein